MLLLQTFLAAAINVQAVTNESGIVEAPRVDGPLAETQKPAVIEAPSSASVQSGPAAEPIITAPAIESEPPVSAASAAAETPAAIVSKPEAASSSAAVAEAEDGPLSVSATTETKVKVTVTGQKSDFSDDLAGAITLQVKELAAATAKTEFDAAVAILDPALPDEKEASRAIRLFEIDLYQNGKLIEPVAPVTVTFADVMKDVPYQSVKIHRIETAAEEINQAQVTIQNDHLQMKVDHFSLYSITALDEPEQTAAASASKTEASTAAMAAITPLAAGDIMAENYFPATGISTNGHYEAKGVYIDASGNIHVLIYKVKSEAATQERFYEPLLNGFPAEIPGGGATWQQFAPYWTNLGLNATVYLPGGQTIPIGQTADPAKDVRRIYDFNFGPMVDHLQAMNTLQILNGAGGFSIIIENLAINIGHAITKTVNKPLATLGDELIYTITVQNTGAFNLTGIDITDTVPAGTTILGVSTNGTTYTPVTVTNNQVMVAADQILAAGTAKTYYVKAYVNDTAVNGQVLTNTAATGGGVPTKSATAQVTIKAANVTVEKDITGNLGEVGRQFPFTVTVSKNQYYGPKTFNFSLTDGGTYNLQNLPTDAVITLAEEAGDYEVMVTVNGAQVLPTAGKYTINVADRTALAIKVTNHKNVIVDTGVALDTTPYVLMMAAVAAIGLVISISIRRRRHGQHDD